MKKIIFILIIISGLFVEAQDYPLEVENGIQLNNTTENTSPTRLPVMDNSGVIKEYITIPSLQTLIGGSGETNTASNLGTGEGLFTTKNGLDLPFKSLVAGNNISLSSDTNEITITGTDHFTPNTLAIDYGFTDNSANWDLAFSWGDHSTQGYITSEINDLTSNVTWANVPDANITQSSVTQHQGALQITESQITDLNHTINTDTQLTEEQVQDIVGGMFTGNTENNISSTYSDGSGKIDLDIDNIIRGDLQFIADYDNIPDEPGYYVIDSNMPSFQNKQTSFKRLEDNTRLTISESNINVGNMIVVRSKTATSNSGGISSEFFFDELFSFKGQRIGAINTSPVGNILQIDIEHGQNILPKNCITDSNENSNQHQYAYIEFDVDESLVINDIIKTPFKLSVQLSKSIKIIESSVILNGKKISDYNIGVISHPFTETGEIAIQDLDCSFCVLKNINHVEIRMKVLGASEGGYFIPSLSRVNYTGENVFNMDSNPSHAPAMELTFDEVYGGFPNTIINYVGDTDLEQSINNESSSANEVISSNVDLLFSAQSGQSSLRGNVYPEQIFKVSSHFDNVVVRRDQTSAIDEFLDNGVMVSSRSLTDNDGSDPLGTSYGFGVEFSEPTLTADFTAQGWTPWGGGAEHQQSPATAVVAAKFKWIKDQTGAPWHIIRKACRLTADNANNYNIYRGFGQINRNAAKTWVDNNYSNTVSQNLANYYKTITPFDGSINFSDKSDHTAATKKDLIDYVGENAVLENYSENGNTSNLDVNTFLLKANNDPSSLSIAIKTESVTGVSPQLTFRALAGTVALLSDVPNINTGDFVQKAGDVMTGKLTINGISSNTTDETLIELTSSGENGKSIEFSNGNGDLAKITGTKQGSGASANEGVIKFETAINAVLEERMRLDSNGNLGIGTDDPTAINGTSTFTKLHSIGANGTGSQEAARFQAGGDFDNTSATVRINHANDRGIYLEGGRAIGDTAFGSIGLTNLVGAKTELIHFHDDNLIGIGKSNPTEKLDVGGDVLADFYKSSDDISLTTTPLSSTNTSGGDLQYAVSNNKLISTTSFFCTNTDPSGVIATLPVGARPNTLRMVNGLRKNSETSLTIVFVDTNGEVTANLESGNIYNLDLEITLDLTKI